MSPNAPGNRLSQARSTLPEAVGTLARCVTRPLEPFDSTGKAEPEPHQTLARVAQPQYPLRVRGHPLFYEVVDVEVQVLAILSSRWWRVGSRSREASMMRYSSDVTEDLPRPAPRRGGRVRHPKDGSRPACDGLSRYDWMEFQLEEDPGFSADRSSRRAPVRQGRRLEGFEE